jgi:MinD superfamily P-loop ATPase
MEIDLERKRGRSIERTNLIFHKNVNESDQHFLADENCNNCGICEKVCPVNNIILVEGNPQWHHKCQQCLACINFCPENAIQYGKRTIGRGRYHHPDITVKDLLNQKQ